MLQLPGHGDAGDASLATPGRLLPTDLGGMQRIYDGAIDIGALEADWRPRFAAATPAVTETATHTVRMDPGQSLAATWAGRPGRTTRFELPLRVTGTGTLTVTVNGEAHAFTAADGESVLRFATALAANAVTAVYDGTDGYAELLAGGRRIGTGLFFR